MAARSVPTALCAAPGCSDLGSHRPGCPGATPGDCRGCLPRLAAPGLALCWPHRDGIERDALRCAEVHEELLLAHLGQVDPSGTVTVSPDPTMNYRDFPGDRREEIMHTLCSWSSMIVQIRGVDPPAVRVDQVARFVAHHADWLAARPETAGDCSTELRRLAHTAIAPDGTRRMTLGKCPVPDCDGEVRATFRHANSLRSWVACTTDRSHVWGQHRWVALSQEIRSAA